MQTDEEADSSPVDLLDGWQNIDFVSNANKRQKGVGWDGFLSDIEIYQTALSNLPTYSAKRIREEIRNWDKDIPNQDELDIRELQGAYSRLVNYRWRVA